MTQSHKHPFFVEKYGNYTWCSQCEHVFETVLWVENAWRCPNSAAHCSGSPLDACDWDSLRMRSMMLPGDPDNGDYFPADD